MHRRLRCSRKRVSRAPEGVSPGLRTPVNAGLWSARACVRPCRGECVRRRRSDLRAGVGVFAIGGSGIGGNGSCRSSSLSEVVPRRARSHRLRHRDTVRTDCSHGVIWVLTWATLSTHTGDSE